MFDLFSDILAGLYALWPSYGAMIILLTLAVRIVFTPLTVRGTKSMLEMRKIQPELKKLQAKHKGDRAALNEEVQALYRTHKINPLGGCLPLLAQAPVFLVMYQVLRGLTRRTSEVGKALGNVVSQIQTCPTGGGGGRESTALLRESILASALSTHAMWTKALSSSKLSPATPRCCGSE